MAKPTSVSKNGKQGLETSQTDAKRIVDAWYSAHQRYVALRDEYEAKIAEARAETQKYAKAIYEITGTNVFAVKAAGADHPGFRAIHKSAGMHKGGKTVREESWDILPVPNNKPELSF